MGRSTVTAHAQLRVPLRIQLDCMRGKVLGCRKNELPNIAVLRLDVREWAELLPEYRLNACNLANRWTRNGEKAKRQYSHFLGSCE